MENKRFKPRYDRYYIVTWIACLAVVMMASAAAFFEPTVLFVLIPVDLLTLYFAISPLFGYVELRDATVYVKLGFILDKEIPYQKIRGFDRKRSFYADSMTSLKTALDHLNIRYNRFDVISVCVESDDELIAEIEARIENFAR